jgi:hypothetical protein
MTNSKNAFWEALIITIFVFGIGIMIGMAYEGNRLDEISEYYAISEISLTDSVALNSISDIDATTCDALIESTIDFADRIYDEAILLEKFEEAGKLTGNLESTHRKYDLLRTILWINMIKASEKCPSTPNVVVYLYEYKTDDLVKKANNQVWSRVLFDFKQEMGNEIILIPIAVDSNLASLDSLIKKHDIGQYPAVIIDQKHVVSRVLSVNDLKTYL